MNKQQAFERLAVEFDLKPADFYFLDLIPLLEMIWADDRNQPEEVAILYKYTIEHIAYLDRQAGAPVISIDDANDFLDRFTHARPSRRLLAELSHIAAKSAHGGENPRSRTILTYCLDIAAACTTRYPYPMHERIMAEEKRLLEKLFRAFNIDPDALMTV